MPAPTFTLSISRMVAFATLLYGLSISLQLAAVPVTIAASSNFTGYQSSTYSGPYVAGSSGVRYMGPNEDVTINSGVTLTIDQGNHTVKSISMGGGASTSIPVLSITGSNKFSVLDGFSSNISSAKRISFSGSGYLVTGGFSGLNYTLVPKTSLIEITSGNLPIGVTSYYKLTINAPGQIVSLGTTATVSHTLELKAGILDISTFNLEVVRIAGTSGISGTPPSKNSYVRTSSGGSLIRTAAQGTLYPVGASIYAPVTLALKNTITKKFIVNVRDGINDINGAPVTSHVIQNLWTISSPTSITADVLITLDWQSVSKEGTGFDTTKNALFIFGPNDTLWSNLNAYTSESSNFQQNLAINKFQNTFPYQFAVGDAGGLNLLNSIIALPVDFISFTATKKGSDMAMLEFATAWEINNAGFEVERSTNGISWNKIGFVPGKGNSTQISNYSFQTSLANLNAPIIYFRLKQIDFNGQYEYSVTRTIRLHGIAENHAIIYPNPATNRVLISANTISQGEVATVSIRDISGKLILTERQLIGNESKVIEVNLDLLPPGSYIIQLASVSVNYSTRLVKL